MSIHRETMPWQQGDDGSKNPLTLSSTTLRCAFVGADELRGGGGGFRGEQLRYPCKLRRHICAECGMHRGEHHGRPNKPNAGGVVRDEHLPPRKRPVFRRLGLGETTIQLPDPDLGGGGEDGGDDDRQGEEGQSCWTAGDAIASKGKRSGARRRRRAAWCEL